MKKKLIIPFFLLICFLIFIIYILWYNGFFISKISAKIEADYLEFNGQYYVTTNGESYTEGRTIAKADNWSIEEIKEDNSHTFVVARSFLDQHLYVLKDYTIPTSGEITKVYWNNKEITDKSLFETVQKIIQEKEVNYTFETEGIFQLTDKQKLRTLYLAYENCPIANVYIGYLGVVEGKWVITMNNNIKGQIPCYEIPQTYIQNLEKYFD